MINFTSVVSTLTMGLFLIAYLVLSTATFIQGHHTHEHKQLEHIVIPSRSHYGPGIDADHMLIYGCERHPEVLNMNCTIIIRSIDGTKNQCNFNLTKRDSNSSVRVKESTQLTMNRTIFEWIERFFEEGRVIHHFEVINTDSCEIIKSKIYSYELKNNLRYINAFEDGFDVVFNDEPCQANRTCYQSFDLDGNEVGEHHVLQMESNSVLVRPISRKTRAKGFYVYHLRHSTVLELRIIGNGQNRRVINTILMRPRLSFVDDHSTVVCGYLKDVYKGSDEDEKLTIECQQYDTMKNDVFKTNLTDDDAALLDVKGLRSGGILLFKYGVSYLVVVEMRPDREIIEHRYEMEKKCKHPRVINFDEERGSFLFACTKQREDDLLTLVMYELMIPSKFDVQGDNTTIKTDFSVVNEAS